MTSRFYVLVAASLCMAMALTRPASAQTEVQLRASYQGEFLPEGTQLVVLSKEGRVQRGDRYQPEFFPTRDFPRATRAKARRDRLADSGLSARRYSGTQDSGHLYFLYALTPDSTLYWSYSAQRDSLKYDVVSTGVMSVAPVLTAEIRDEILGSYFQSRVTVVMRDEEDEDETVAAGDDSERIALHQDTLAAAAGTTDPTPAPPDTSTAAAAIPPVASAQPPVRPASAGVSPLLFWSMLLVLLAAAAVPAYFARTYRTELRQVRREMLTLRDRKAGADDSAELRASLEDAELRRQQLEEDYAILEARYDALLKESEAQRV